MYDMTTHKLAVKYIKENLAITEKFYQELVAERAIMASDTWTIDFMIKDIENRKKELLEALSEAIHCIVENSDPKRILKLPS
jgi:hypothetical protein